MTCNSVAGWIPRLSAFFHFYQNIRFKLRIRHEEFYKGTFCHNPIGNQPGVYQPPDSKILHRSNQMQLFLLLMFVEIIFGTICHC